MDAYSSIEQQVRLYGTQAEEAWRRDHEDAMACRDFEGVLAFGVFLFENLVRLDEAWRADVLAGRRPYAAEEAATVRALFEWWNKPCDRVEARIRHFEQRGFTVEGAEQFRRDCAEASWMLASAKDALASDKLARLGDEAVEEHRRGETVPAE